MQAPAGTAGFGIALDVLGLELGLAVDADIGRGVARRPKPPPEEGPSAETIGPVSAAHRFAASPK